MARMTKKVLMVTTMILNCRDRESGDLTQNVRPFYAVPECGETSVKHALLRIRD